jgi:anti-anti-sigma regulatory factor
MFKSEVDTASNLLKVRYAGRVSSAETKRAAGEVEEVLKGVQPGFRLLADLSELESMDLDCVPDLEQMMDACNKHGVTLVVRVIPEPPKDIGMNIMSLFHYHRGVRIVTCATLAEAARVLES